MAPPLPVAAQVPPFKKLWSRAGRALAERGGGTARFRLLRGSGLVLLLQLALAQRVMGAPGRAVGGDHLEPVIEVRTNGEVVNNGLPAPF